MTETIFENDGKKYVYDVERISVEQAEIAKEILEFKYNTLKNPPKEIAQIFRSRLAEWSIMILSYLLLKMDADGKVIPFNIDLVSETEKFVKTLPIKETGRIKECVENFFQYIGSGSMYSQVSSNARSLNASEILSALLPAMLMKNATASLENENE